MRQRSRLRLGMDIFMIAAFALGVVAAVAYPWINDPKTSNKEEVPKVAGDMFVSLQWPPGDCDVDLWVHDDQSNVAVGYSNKLSSVFNHLKDDLGATGDPYGALTNVENSITRKLIDGQYTINAHLFNPKTCDLPIEVTLEVRGRSSSDKPFLTWFTVRDRLEVAQEERTLANFTVYDSKFIRESMNSIFKPIIEWKEGSIP